MPERHHRCIDPLLHRSTSLSHPGRAALEDPVPRRRRRCFGGGPTLPLSVMSGSHHRSYAMPGSHRREPRGGGDRTRGWLETVGTGEAPRRREEAGPRWLPDISERRPIAWGRGTAQEGEAGSSGGAWPSDSVAAMFGEE
jgi:hypothetical protein